VPHTEPLPHQTALALTAIRLSWVRIANTPDIPQDTAILALSNALEAGELRDQLRNCTTAGLLHTIDRARDLAHDALTTHQALAGVGVSR
jgi:hypothetical protein